MRDILKALIQFAFVLILSSMALGNTAYALENTANDITSILILDGDSEYNQEDESILLCPAVTWSSGVAKYPYEIEQDFDISFEYKIGGGSGADGIVFAFFTKEHVVDNKGEYLNFNDCGGYGIELDTYQNQNDSSKPHAALLYNEVSNHLISVDDERIRDNKWRLMNISLENNHVAVRIDGQVIIDRIEDFDKTNKHMYFAASTGSSTDNHYIRNVTYNGKQQIAAEAIQTGFKIKLPALTTGKGFRIYRSEISGAEGEVIADLISGTSFIDVNVEAKKTYYYTVHEVFADNGLSEKSDEIALASPEELLGADIEGERGFILMKIGEPMMSVNGSVQEIDPGRGTVPVIQNGRTLVPIRAIIEAMNGNVDWNNSAKQITLDTSNHHIEMWLEQKGIVVDGVNKGMDIAPTTINDRTMLPIRFVAENAGCAIEWIASTQEIVIVFSVN